MGDPSARQIISPYKVCTNHYTTHVGPDLGAMGALDESTTCHTILGASGRRILSEVFLHAHSDALEYVSPRIAVVNSSKNSEQRTLASRRAACVPTRSHALCIAWASGAGGDAASPSVCCQNKTSLLDCLIENTSKY